MNKCETWYELYEKLYGYLLTIVKNEEIAKDILHDSFLKIYEKRKLYKFYLNLSFAFKSSLG